jgi:Ca-activated chloride channel family protein
MEGEKFEQAQEALRYILSKLNPEDRFNLIAFSTGIELFANDLQPSFKVEDAIPWVNQLRAEGSTDINRALLEAASMIDGERPAYLIFLTDGLPTVGEVNSEKIITNLQSLFPKNMSLFAFGVGYDVDTYLLDSLAQAHHGSSTYVVPGEPLDEILSTFYSKISAPVLTDLNLDFGNLVAYDIYPHPLPDLFVGSQIAVVGRYREGGSIDVTLSGDANGNRQRYVYGDQLFAERSTDLDGSITALPSLWATRKIGYLLQQVRLNGPEREIVDEIVKLSIRYGIVTPYTSYLVTEPTPLGIEEQERIAAEQFNNFSDQAALPSFGKQAVEEAEGQSSLANADAVAAAPAEALGKVHTIGSHTFILSDGVWIDTMYDPERMEVIEIEFLSNEYFTLARNRPELAAAFALGSRVIVISGNEIYEVVEGPLSYDNADPQPPPLAINIDQPAPTRDVQVTEEPVSDSSKSPGNTSGLCLGGLVVSLLPIITFGLVRIKKKIE